jgi:glutamate formiminotransferase
MSECARPNGRRFLECVINISEGTRTDRLDPLIRAAGGTGLDLHRDRFHNRSVLTLGGRPDAVEAAARAVATVAVETLDLGTHQGVHPRFGVVDVVPFVSLDAGALDSGSLGVGALGAAVAARDRFAGWAGSTLGLPCFLYGTGRTLPEIRRQAWNPLAPDTGPPAPHPTAGSVAVGARPVLVAYNLWLAEPDLARARSIAAAIRGPTLRALGLRVGPDVQVSCNLIDPASVGPAAAFDAVASRAAVSRAELVGLIPRSVLDAAPRHRWPELDLDPSATIEARLERAGLDRGRFDGRRH